MKLVNKRELKYILLSVAFAFFFFVFVLPYLAITFDGKSPYLQFILFNVGIYIFFFIFLKGIATSQKIPLKNAFGLTLLFLGIDILMPDYHVLTNGNLLEGAVLGVSSSDYFFGNLINQSGLSFSIFGIAFSYIFTYIIAPFALLLIASLLLKDFTKHL